MKFFIATTLLTLSLSIGASTNPQDCMKMTDLDSRQCLDSYIESVRNTIATDTKSLVNGVPQGATIIAGMGWGRRAAGEAKKAAAYARRDAKRAAAAERRAAAGR